METLHASKAEPGEIYLSHTGAPLRVIGPKGSGIEIESLTTDNRIVLAPGALLQTYDKFKLNREAVILMSAKNGTKKVINAETGKVEIVRKQRLENSLARVGDRRTIRREYKGKELVMTVNAEGFHVGGKTYKSLTAAAQGVTGTKITTGPAFWGFAK